MPLREWMLGLTVVAIFYLVVLGSFFCITYIVVQGINYLAHALYRACSRCFCKAPAAGRSRAGQSNAGFVGDGMYELTAATVAAGRVSKLRVAFVLDYQNHLAKERATRLLRATANLTSVKIHIVIDRVR